MKKWLLIILINILLLSLVSATSSTKITTDGKDYNFELLAVNHDNAKLSINNENLTLKNVQASLYSFETTDSLKGLKYALTELHYPTYAGDVKYINLLVLFEKNISSGTRKTLSYNGAEYSVLLSNIVSDSEVSLKINNNNDSILFNKVQASQPYSVDSVIPTSDLKYVITSINNPSSMTILLGFEINLLIECNANWTCSDWEECINNSQKRSCSDTGFCGSNKNKPIENQSCVSNVTIPILQICSDECNASEKKCFNQSYYQVCGNYDNDSCREWGKDISCSSSNSKMICNGNGVCTKEKISMTTWIFYGTIGVIALLIIIVAMKLIMTKKNKSQNQWLNT